LDIDTVNVVIGGPISAAARNKLGAPEQAMSSKKGQRTRGHLGNFYVSSSEARTFMSGSLAKAQDPSGIGQFDFSKIGEELDRLADGLELDRTTFDQCKVTRCDIGAMFWVDRPVSEYLRALRKPPRMTEIRYGTKSVTFKVDAREIEFYDRIPKAKKAYRRATGSDLIIPPEFENLYLLRGEVRFKKRLPEVFGQPVTVATLREGQFHQLCHDLWREQFCHVQFQRVPRFYSGLVWKNLRDALALRGLESVGPTQVVCAVADAQTARRISRREASRLKAYLDRLQTNATLTIESDVESEFNKLVGQLAICISDPPL